MWGGALVLFLQSKKAEVVGDYQLILLFVFFSSHKSSNKSLNHIYKIYYC